MKIKTVFLALAIALCFAAPVLAHQSILDKKSVEYYVEKVDQFRTVYLTYNSMSKNLMVIVVTNDDYYDEGDTSAWIRDRIENFAKEKNFKHYRNYSDDIIRWKNENVEFTRFVILYN